MRVLFFIVRLALFLQLRYSYLSLNCRKKQVFFFANVLQHSAADIFRPVRPKIQTGGTEYFFTGRV